MNKEYLLKYEQSLEKVLLDMCYSNNFLDSTLLEAEELNEVWNDVVPEYLADSVSMLNDYPTVAVAWATYFGMAMGALWDGDWESYSNRKDIYTAMRDVRGFDNMDEYILEDILALNLESVENKKLEDMIRSMAQMAISTIRKEQIEAGTPEAYFIFASTTKVMYRLGISLQLKRLGYRYEKVEYDANDISIN